MRGTALRLLAVLLLALPVAARAAADTYRIAFVGPLSGPLAASGEESLLGARIAAEAAALGRPVEVVPLDDGNDPARAAEVMKEAQKSGAAAVLVAATGVTVGPHETQARKGRVPVVFVGSAAPAATVREGDPVLFTGAWPADQALSLAGFLAIHSEKSGLGLYRDCLEPAVVFEDTPRGVDMVDALARNLAPRQHLSGRVRVKPGEGPTKEDLAKLAQARCDRLVLVGEPDLVDRTAEAMKAAGMSVPIFCADGMLSRAAKSLHDGTITKANFLYGVPARAMVRSELLPDEGARGTPAEFAREAVEKRLGPGAPFYPRIRAGWFGAWTVIQALEEGRRPGFKGSFLDALRAVHYSKEEEREAPVYDVVGRGALQQWFCWTQGEKGPEPIKPIYLPTRDIGPLLRAKRVEDWDKVAVNDDTQIVWLTFGEKEPEIHGEPARTIEEDMGFLGLGTRGYEAEMDPWLLEELQIRTLGKINRLFLKNYDGTFVPGVSFNIHFTFTKPDLKPNRYWTGTIAGEQKIIEDKDPEKADRKNAELPGGEAKGNRVFIYSRWMRKYTAIKDKGLRPKMNRDDRKYMDGTYSWGTTYEENIRSDLIRALVDGYSSWFAMTGAHEFGHVCGCGHDTQSTRSIMNVVDAVGLRDTQACWIPIHVNALEKTLGRYGEKRK